MSLFLFYVLVSSIKISYYKIKININSKSILYNFKYLLFKLNNIFLFIR
jgi:uncharacterized membrane protein YgaE (UPF0421/DUF939 family)